MLLEVLMLLFIVSTSKQKNTSDYTNTPTPHSPFLSSKRILIKTGTACFKALCYYGYKHPPPHPPRYSSAPLHL